MTKTKFSKMDYRSKNEIIQDLIDLLSYNEEASVEILKIINVYPKPYEMKPLMLNGKETFHKVRTIVHTT